MIEHVEHLGDPRQFDRAELDVLCQMKVDLVKRVAHESVSWCDAAGRDHGRTVEPIGDTRRNRERRPAVEAVVSRTGPKRIQPNRRRVVVAGSEEIGARHRDVPGQPVDGVRAQRVPLKIGRSCPFGAAIELIARLILEVRRVVVIEQRQRVGEACLKVVPETARECR